MTRAADALVALLFPQGCHVCGGAVLRRADGVACAACWTDPRVTPLYDGSEGCERCGAPGSGMCVACVPAELSASRSAGRHAGALRAALLDLKLRPRVCRRLSDLLVETWRGAPALHAADLVVPVPLHPDRLAARGHNQALSLAEGLARAAGLELSIHALKRVRATAKRRAGLGRAARAEAVRAAFRAAPRLVEGRVVLVVDDLLTTGATLGACARALRAAGACDVVALTAARAPLLR
ncbi:MAG TPA: phosphoribosyltransferase family protein [Planctomycetota bacterium]|nr:phosphoribosyltransferase family protein [Planctomycetota bacterium]